MGHTGMITLYDTQVFHLLDTFGYCGRCKAYLPANTGKGFPGICLQGLEDPPIEMIYL